jgi:protein-disulfide isomerase
MVRRLFVLLFRRSVLAVVLLCLGCAAQSNSNPADLNQRIERRLRVYLSGQVPPSVQISVGPRTPSPDFPNYDKITVTLSLGERKQTTDFLLSKDGKELVRVTKLDISKDPFAEIMSKLDVAGRPVRGNKDAKVTIVNFDDFECPFCSRMHQTLVNDILKAYGDRVRVIYKDYPLAEIHPWATRAAIDANCVAAQSPDAYWDLADYFHANQREITGSGKKLEDQFKSVDEAAIMAAQKHKVDLAKLQSCIKAQPGQVVKDSVKEATGLGIQATPTMFVNGDRVDGALPPAELHAIIDRALREAGQPVPTQAAAVSPAAPAPAAQTPAPPK